MNQNYTTRKIMEVNYVSNAITIVSRCSSLFQIRKVLFHYFTQHADNVGIVTNHNLGGF